MSLPAININDHGDPNTKALLEQAYRTLIQNYQREIISPVFRNQNLSGDLNSGSLKAARYANSKSQLYGTARAAQRGNPLREKPVLVQIKRLLEIMEEFEQFDARTAPAYLKEVISGRNDDHARTIARDTEEDFFLVGRNEGTQVTLTGANPAARFEEVVLQLTTLENDFFKGISRNMIYVTMNDATYSAFRVHLNLDTRNSNVNSAAENFMEYNGVKVFPTPYMPSNVNIMAQARGSIAMPNLVLPYMIDNIQLSYATALTTGFALTATAVMPDTIFWA